MITVEFVLGIIFIVLSLTGLAFCVTMTFATTNGNWMWSLIPFAALTVAGAAMVSETPRESDVLDGKAHYVEVYHTYNNDTIKTYHINWNKKSGAHRQL